MWVGVETDGISKYICRRLIDDIIFKDLKKELPSTQAPKTTMTLKKKNNNNVVVVMKM